MSTIDSISAARPKTSVAVGRRAALSAIAGGLAWPLMPGVARAGADRRLFMSARGVRAGTKLDHRASGFDGAGRVIFDIPIPARAHGLAVNPRKPVVVLFARRPGTFARAIDFARGTLIAAFETPADRHFYGHGAFSPDGKLLYAAENDFANQRGVIGVYDAAQGFRRRGELQMRGIGPHEIRVAGDGNTLVIGLGGIMTHPDQPRVKLNLPTMKPSLVYLDRRDGKRISEVRLPASLHQLSIRHLSIGPKGAVAVGMQYQGPRSDLVPLVGVHEPGRPLRPFSGPERIMRSMNNYCASVEFDATGSVVAATSPRGDVIAFWEAESGRFLSSADIPGVCGLTAIAGPGKFVATSLRGGDKGGVFAIDAVSGISRKITSHAIEGTLWDNHLVAATT